MQIKIKIFYNYYLSVNTFEIHNTTELKNGTMGKLKL